MVEKKTKLLWTPARLSLTKPFSFLIYTFLLTLIYFLVNSIHCHCTNTIRNNMRDRIVHFTEMVHLRKFHLLAPPHHHRSIIKLISHFMKKTKKTKHKKWKMHPVKFYFQLWHFHSFLELNSSRTFSNYYYFFSRFKENS